LKITLPRNQIKKVTQGIGKVVHGKCTVPVLGCVRFDADTNGAAACATDLDQPLDYRFEDAQIDGPGSCIIPFSCLKDLSKGNGNERVEIQSDHPEEVTLTNFVGGHAMSLPVTGMALEEWPALDTNVATQPADGFVETYRRLVPFSSTDETRRVLNSVFAEVADEGDTPVTMVATDGMRLAAWNSLALPLSKSVVIPITRFLAWNKLPNAVELGIREDNGVTCLGVKAGAFTYSVKCIDGTFPNYRQVIPANPGGNVIAFTDSDVDLLKQVLPTFPGDESVTLVGNEGKVTVYGRAEYEARWTSLTLENTTYLGERTCIGLNRQFLMDALSIAGFREFAFTDALSPLLARDGKGGQHILMPLRAEDPEKEAIPVQEQAPEVHPVPEVETVYDRKNTQNTTRQRRKSMTNKENEPKSEKMALNHVLTACNAAKLKVREAGQALSELTTAIRAAAREQRVQAKEVDSARAALTKLQAISL